MQKLNRIRVGEFDISNSITIEELEQNKNNRQWMEEKIIEIKDIFEDNKKIELTQKEMNLFLNGVKLTKKEPDGTYKIYNENIEFVGTGEIRENKLKRDVII